MVNIYVNIATCQSRCIATCLQHMIHNIQPLSTYIITVICNQCLPLCLWLLRFSRFRPPSAACPAAGRGRRRGCSSVAIWASWKAGSNDLDCLFLCLMCFFFFLVIILPSLGIFGPNLFFIEVQFRFPQV